MKLKLLSPAKINLFLRILRRRDDGYHDIASLFQAINVYDTLTMSLSEGDLFTCDDPNLTVDQTNLVRRAVDLFRNKTGIRFCVDIQLEKKIPTQSGLGGGSSNAATTLWGLNKLLKANLSEKDLQNWSAELGSDVPFFFSSGTAFCTGRGENISDLHPLSLEAPFFLFTTREGLSTQLVFKKLDFRSELDPDPQLLLEHFLNGNIAFYNDLEVPAFQLMPKLAVIKSTLSKHGNPSIMTGSGTAFLSVATQASISDGMPISFIQRDNRGWYKFVP